LRKTELMEEFKVKFKDYKEKHLDNKEDNKHKDEKSLKFAYITFKSMDDVEVVQKAYKPDRCERCCIFYCKKEAVPNLEQKFIFKKWPEVRVARLPDNINWKNIGYSGQQIMLRKCVVQLIAIAILLMALVGFSYIETQTDIMRGDADYQLFTNNDCDPPAFWKMANQTRDQAIVPKKKNGEVKNPYPLDTNNTEVKQYVFETQVRTMLNDTGFVNKYKISG
jgi:hypothetical protein